MSLKTKKIQIKEHTSLGGHIAWTTKGRVDYWVTECSSPIAQLRNYPYNTHGHCKTAYSPFWKALIVLPNSMATEQGKYELYERTGFKRMVKAQEMSKECLSGKQS